MSTNRRDWMKRAAGFAAGALVTPTEATPEVKQKLAGSTEFTTACNFCSCGCGMVGHVKDGELINLEGDPEHVINEGALCSKGAAVIATHASEQRITSPMYRAPGSNQWQTISWQEAMTKISGKIRQVRDATWIATEEDGENEFPVNRTDGIAFCVNTPPTLHSSFSNSSRSALQDRGFFNN